MKQTPIKILIAITICIVVPLMVQAQPAEPNDAAGVPIDGGLGLLLAAGAGYGIKKIRGSRSKIK